MSDKAEEFASAAQIHEMVVLLLKFTPYAKIARVQARFVHVNFIWLPSRLEKIEDDDESLHRQIGERGHSWLTGDVPTSTSGSTPPGRLS